MTAAANGTETKNSPLRAKLKFDNDRLMALRNLTCSITGFTRWTGGDNGPPCPRYDSTMAKILLVEDDKKLADTVQVLLEMDQHKVEVAFDGLQAEDRLAAFDYDLLILDWDLPAKSGVEVCREFRDRGGSTPVLMLTGKQLIDNKEEGFNAGADDYLTKPYHPRELVARVKALLRRQPVISSDVLTWRDIQLDSTARKVMKNGEDVAMQPMEFTLLSFFLKHPGQVFTTEALLKRCWDDSDEVSFDSIYTCIRRIRRKMDREGVPSVIRTVHGVGYSLGDPQ